MLNTKQENQLVQAYKNNDKITVRRLKMSITKGKWEVQSRFLIVNEDRKIIANLQPVARSDQKTSFDESEANANLIAAAPETKRQRDDLLEACKIGLAYTERSNSCTQPDCLVCKRTKEDIEKIKNAIAQTEN